MTAKAIYCITISALLHLISIIQMLSRSVCIKIHLEHEILHKKHLICIDFIEVFCIVYDSCIHFEKWWYDQLLSCRYRKRHRKTKMYLCKIVTILLYCPHSGIKNFKHYYMRVIGHNV